MQIELNCPGTECNLWIEKKFTGEVCPGKLIVKNQWTAVEEFLSAENSGCDKPIMANITHVYLKCDTCKRYYEMKFSIYRTSCPMFYPDKDGKEWPGIGIHSV